MHSTTLLIDPETREIVFDSPLPRVRNTDLVLHTKREHSHKDRLRDTELKLSRHVRSRSLSTSRSGHDDREHSRHHRHRSESRGHRERAERTERSEYRRSFLRPEDAVETSYATEEYWDNDRQCYTSRYVYKGPFAAGYDVTLSSSSRDSSKSRSHSRSRSVSRTREVSVSVSRSPSPAMLPAFEYIRDDASDVSFAWSSVSSYGSDSEDESVEIVRSDDEEDDDWVKRTTRTRRTSRYNRDGDLKMAKEKVEVDTDRVDGHGVTHRHRTTQKKVHWNLPDMKILPKATITVEREIKSAPRVVLGGGKKVIFG